MLCLSSVGRDPESNELPRLTPSSSCLSPVPPSADNPKSSVSWACNYTTKLSFCCPETICCSYMDSSNKRLELLLMTSPQLSHLQGLYLQMRFHILGANGSMHLFGRTRCSQNHGVPGLCHCYSIRLFHT